MSPLDSTHSDMRLFSKHQARDFLIERLNENPELFLEPTTALDKGIIYNIFIEEGIKHGIDYHEQTLENTSIDSPYIRAQYDLEVGIPYRIALIGWILLDNIQISILKRLFLYAIDPSHEKMAFFNKQLEYILKGYATKEILEEIFQDAELNMFIDKKLRECAPEL